MINTKPKIYTLVFAIFCSITVSAQNTPVGMEGIKTIINFYDQKPIVAIGETHGHLQLYQFLSELVQTKEFYTNVNDILIESGNALYQDTLDKYIFGGNVAFDDLQKVWLNTTQSPVDPWSNDVYYKFLTTVRELNSRLPDKHKIRIVAADPPILWTDVKSNEDYLSARGDRNEYYAQRAITEVLSKNRTALLINGGAHFGNHNSRTVNQRIEARYPNTVTVILARSGLWEGNEDKEKELNWATGTLVKVKNTWIGLLPGPRRVAMVAPSTNNASDSSSISTQVPSQPVLGPPSKYKRQDYFDYLLYLGTAADLAYGSIDPSIYASETLWIELNRRSMIRFNHKLTESSRETGILRPEAYN